MTTSMPDIDVDRAWQLIAETIGPRRTPHADLTARARLAERVRVAGQAAKVQEVNRAYGVGYDNESVWLLVDVLRLMGRVTLAQCRDLGMEFKGPLKLEDMT